MILALRIAIAGALLVAPVMAQSQTDGEPKQQQMRDAFAQQTTTDVPLGAPYRTGESGSGQSQVPLRDYLSSRIDQLRAEMLDRMETLERQQTKIQDERDRQYSQRFEAQQKETANALVATKESAANALQAIKESSTNALAAAKEAVVKAEDAANKRFESVNEFRQTLADQAQQFIGKETAEARFNAMDIRFKTLEEKTANNASRLDNIKSLGEGAQNLWGYIIGGIGILMVLATFALNALRARPVLK